MMTHQDSPAPGSAPLDLVILGGDGGPSGVPRHISQLARALVGTRKIHVVHDQNRGGYDFVPAMGLEGLELRGLKTSLSLAQWARAWRGLSALFERHAEDIIWAHARVPVLLSRVILWRRARARRPLPRLIVTYHGLPFGPGHRPGFVALSRWVERKLIRFAPPHELVFLTRDAADTFAQNMTPGTLDRHRLHILGNCSDLAPRAHRPEGRVLAMTGRDAWQKNLDAAAPILARLGQAWQLRLCGAGTDGAGLKDRFSRLLNPDILRRVRFLGPQDDIRPVLEGASCFLMTSRYEGLSIAALEAFEAGLPLALPDVAGTADILAHHPLAVRIEPTQPAESARRIAGIVARYEADPEHWQAQIRAAWAARFSCPVQAAHMRALLEDPE